MNYRTNYVRNPGPEAAARLVNYIQGPVVYRGAGIPASEADLSRFQTFVAGSAMSRHHVFAFANIYEPEELAIRLTRPLRRELGGTFVLGIHTETENSNHVHVAEAGTSQECEMDADDIDRVRQAVAAQVPESIGDGGKS